jgi:hypothetical protein
MLVAGWGLGFHFRVLGFGGGGNRFEPACNWFRVVGRVVSSESFRGLAWVGCGVPWVVCAGGVSLPYVCPFVYLLGVHYVSSLLWC